MNKQQLYRYTGGSGQLYGLRRLRLQEGSATGCTVIEAVSAGGIHADILPDTGLDIGIVRYKGKNVSFLSKNGYDCPANFSACAGEFPHSFSGGLLYTCGLRSTGQPCDDGGEFHPLHGRVHGKQAACLGAFIECDNMIVQGTLREAALFGHALEVRRRIIIPIWGSSIIIEDEIENITPFPEEFTILYHVNYGYPLLSETARLILPGGRETKARTAYAEEGLGKECEFSAPIDGEDEQVYFHKLNEGCAILENKEAGMAAALRWSLDSLPVLVQWKCMRSGDYALGLEPANNYVLGRAGERENGTLQVLDAFSSVKTRLELEFSDI